MKTLIAFLALTSCVLAQTGNFNFNQVKAQTGTIGTLTLGTSGGVGLAARITGTGTGNATITFNSGAVEFNTSGSNPTFDFQKQATFTGGWQLPGGSSGATIGSGVTVTNLGTISGGNIYAEHFSSNGSAARITLPASAGTSGQVLALGTNGVTTSWVTPSEGSSTGTASSLIAGATIGNIPVITASVGTANTTITVSLAGNTTFDASGTVPGFAFSDSVALNAGASLAAGQTFTNSGTISGGAASGLTLASGTTTLAGVLSGGTVANALVQVDSASINTITGRSTVLSLGGFAGGDTAVTTRFRVGTIVSASAQMESQTTSLNHLRFYNSASALTTFRTTADGAMTVTTSGTAGGIVMAGTGGWLHVQGTLPAGNPATGYFIGIGTGGALSAKGTAGTITILANP